MPSTPDHAAPTAAPKKERRKADREAPDWLQCDHGHILDLSRDGVRLLATRRHAGIREMRIWDNGSALELSAEVMWSKRLGFRRHEVGLQFIDLTGSLADELDQLGSGLKFRN